MPASLPWPCSPQEFAFGDDRITALVPVPAALRERFLDTGGEAPYWARVWPAALGLCGFLAENRALVRGRRVLELAAGIGLPGLLSARWAAEVILSDIDPDAVAVMQGSAALNGMTNLSCRSIDWNCIPGELQPELVLLSDVNYEPAIFDSLFRALEELRLRGIPVVLSTPQRLMAKPFIERLRPMIRERHEVEAGGQFVSIFEL